MNVVKVADVEGIQNPALGRCQMEMIFVTALNHASIRGSNDIHAAGTQSTDKVAIHRVFVDI
jgi:hypothetical protein